MKPLKLMRVLVLLILPCVLVVSGCNGTTDAGSSTTDIGSSGVEGFSISSSKLLCWKVSVGNLDVSTKIKVTGKIKNNTQERAKVHLEASYYDSPDASDNALWADSFWEPTDSYIAPGVTKNFTYVFTAEADFYTQICVPGTHYDIQVTDVENA